MTDLGKTLTDMQEPSESPKPNFLDTMKKPENLLTGAILLASLVQDRRAGQSALDAAGERVAGTIGFRSQLQGGAQDRVERRQETQRRAEVDERRLGIQEQGVALQQQQLELTGLARQEQNRANELRALNDQLNASAAAEDRAAQRQLLMDRNRLLSEQIRQSHQRNILEMSLSSGPQFPDFEVYWKQAVESQMPNEALDRNQLYQEWAAMRNLHLARLRGDISDEDLQNLTIEDGFLVLNRPSGEATGTPAPAAEAPGASTEAPTAAPVRQFEQTPAENFGDKVVNVFTEARRNRQLESLQIGLKNIREGAPITRFRWSTITRYGEERLREAGATDQEIAMLKEFGDF